MITTLLLCWIGTQLSAPWWFYVALIVRALLSLVSCILDADLKRKIREHLNG